MDQRSTPPRLAELARAALEEVQLNRAYEGQHLSSPQTLDTDRLALSSLILQPGWSDQVHLEARHRSVDGALWNAVGPADAPIRRTLVRLGSGRYVAYEGGAALCGETDLYAAILHALPDAQRNALGIDIHAGPELRRRLADRPLARETLRVLLDAPAPEAVRVETLRLLGNTVGYAGEPPTAAQPLSLGQRIRALFPILDEQQAQQMIDAMAPGSADVAVAALETIHLQLQSTLATWQNDIPTHHPTFGTELAARQRRYELRNRRLIVEQIQQCWRRETDADNHYGDHTRDGFTLQLRWPIMGELPPLATEFAHVSFLSLLGAESTSGTARFIEHFPRLRHLEIRETPLGELPASISAMPALRNLSLDNCNVVLTPQGAARLAAMSRLENLNLHQNPLGHLPDVQSMSDLEALDLSRTGIDQLPAGLLNLPRLRTAFLSGNRLRELPPALFELSPSSSQRFDFSGNPLAQPTLERIKAYYQQHSTYWEADAAPVDQRDTRLLFPSMNNDSVNKFIFSLPGDIEAGRRELARLAQELGTLQTQLSAWSTETGLPDLEQARRQALHQLLERSWRRQTPQGTQFIHSLMIPRAMAGDLPALSAQFKHIGYLSLEGNGGSMQVNTFIQSFAALDILNIQDARLGDIPATVFDAPTLTHLSLPRCGITLTDASQTALQGMTRLQHLDLGENPLGRAVDFRQLVNLQEVSLQYTGLTQAPAGLLTQNRSMSINLSRNAIQELPDAIFTLPATLTHRLDLYANPLSRRSLNQIKAYCQRTGEFFNAQAPAAERERVEALYPFLLENEADRFIFRLPGDMADVAGHVTRLEAEYQQLGIDLDQWILDIPERHPLLDFPLDEHTRAQEQLHRRDFKTLLEQAWRRESAEDEESLDDELTHSLSIDTPIMGALPQLSARIGHISRFEFFGNGTTTAVDGTLQCFPNLQTLNVQRCSLRALPRSLFSMRKLCSVELNYCEITLTEDAARSVNDLSAMEFLDLSNNPLNLPPDVSGIQSLIALHLRSTQITRVPPGVFQLTELQVLDLSSNQITEIPADLLEMIPSLNEDSDLSANPLSAQSLAYLRTYFQRTGNDFEVPGATWDEQGNALPQPFPHPQEE